MVVNYELLFRSFSQAVFFLDQDGYVKFSNPAATNITGYTADELKNKSFFILYSDDDYSNSIKGEYELSTALKAGKFIAEGWKKKKDGTKFWAEMVIAPVYDGQNSSIGFTCT